MTYTLRFLTLFRLALAASPTVLKHRNSKTGVSEALGISGRGNQFAAFYFVAELRSSFN
jgi:hypothetical protein